MIVTHVRCGGCGEEVKLTLLICLDTTLSYWAQCDTCASSSVVLVQLVDD